MNYPNPFIEERADPFITKGNDGFYYFTASYPAFENVRDGYDRIILRRSETVSGLRTAQEHTIWHAHEKGDMSAHIWAPEIHYIGGKWYIFFAAGNIDDIWAIRPYMLVCEGNDPINDSWRELGRVHAGEGDDISFQAFSLDMTHFEHEGIHYLIWAEKRDTSVLMMSEINPDEPGRLLRKPILLTKPEYKWEMVRHKVNEGPSVIKTDNKIIVFFSASGTGEEYCMGMVYADKNSDLMNPGSWIKLTSPVLSSGDLTGEVGPGHNSFVTDENGKTLIVYHARPSSHLKKSCKTYCEESLYDPCRHTRIKEIRFDENEMPVII